MKPCDATALILEDSRTQAQIIGKMVEACGWGTVHCETIREAVDSLKLMSVQALFLDVFVGSHNTLLHLDRFRTLARSVPVILMTAGTSRDAIEETLNSARKTGAEYVLRKPFSEKLIGNVLDTIALDAVLGVKRKHALIIDDSQTVRLFSAQALEAGGYRVSQAGSMEEAFDNIDIAHVDLLLCDVFMPGMGGLKGMRTIKATWPRVKIICMSAGLQDKVSDSDALNASRRLGADAQICKPFTKDDLLDLSQMMFQKAA